MAITPVTERLVPDGKFCGFGGSQVVRLREVLYDVVKLPLEVVEARAHSKHEGFLGIRDRGPQGNREKFAGPTGTVIQQSTHDLLKMVGVNSHEYRQSL